MLFLVFCLEPFGVKKKKEILAGTKFGGSGGFCSKSLIKFPPNLIKNVDC